MQSHLFIFSNKAKYRIARHAAFWISWWLFQGFLYAFPSYGNGRLNFVERLPYTLLNSLLFMTSHIFLAYSLMYFVVPVYLLKNKYLATAVWIIIFFIATGAMASVTALYIVDPVRTWLLPASLLLSRGPDQTSFLWD